MSNVMKAFRTAHLRLFQPVLYSKCMSTKPEVTKQEVKEESYPTVDEIIRNPMHYPTNFDKRILVFAGKYKKIEDVPKTITAASFDGARNKARIKLANYMMLATVVACLCVAISGRRAAERGESVHQMNIDWHNEMNKK